MLQPDMSLLSNMTANITCAGGYYLSDSGVCRPLCSNWVEPKKITLDYIAITVTIVIGLLSALILLVLAVTIQRETM